MNNFDSFFYENIQVQSYWMSTDPENNYWLDIKQVSKKDLFPISKSKAYVLYRVVNLINGKVYVGQHLGKHDDNYMGSGRRIKYAIKKYGIENFKRINAIYTNNKSFIDQLEKDFIGLEKQMNPDKCYNIHEGGKGGDLMKYATPEDKINKNKRIRQAIKNRSPEQKQLISKRMSESAKGKVISFEAKRKISDFHRGKILSNETKLKMSESRKGFKHTKESIEKMAMTKRGVCTITPEGRRKLSEFNKGKILSKEHIERLRESGKGRHHSTETKKKIGSYHKGKVISEWHKNKVSEVNRGLKWYKNEITGKNIRLKSNDTVPEGYVRGRIVKKQNILQKQSKQFFLKFV